ncbi:unnamed protein product [Peniophora sp. CBMAI 1063]|nr:unnamed protein product [Peniophora sp. CBMAI 1063]
MVPTGDHAADTHSTEKAHVDAGNSNPQVQLGNTRLMPTDRGDTRSASQGRLEDIEQLGRRLQRAVGLDDAHSSPLLSLPDELIVKIIRRVRESNVIIERSTQSRLSRPVPWNVTVTVCRRLRQIVAGSPSLHTHLSNVLHSTYYLDLSIVRSDPLPLNLYISEPSQYGMDEMRQWTNGVLKVHGHRIESITFQTSRSNLSGVPDWLNHTPCLRSLSLHYDVDHNSSGTINATAESILSAIFAALTTSTKPKVEHVASLCINGPLPPYGVSAGVVYHNLTDLSLRNVIFSFISDPGLSIILSLTTRLERLTLHNVCPVDISMNPSFMLVSPHPPLALPSTLRVLDYSGSKHPEFVLLEAFIPNTSTRLIITCTDEMRRSVVRIRRVLELWMGPGRLTKAATLHITNNGVNNHVSYAQVKLSLWSACDEDMTCPPDIEYNFDRMEIGGNSLMFLPDMMNGPSYEGLQRLHAKVDDTTYSLLQSWRVGHHLQTPHLRDLSLLPNLASEPHFSLDVWFFRRWLHSRYATGNLLHTLTISSEMADALDGLGESRPQPSCSAPVIMRREDFDEPPPETLGESPSWRDTVSEVVVVNLGP